MHACINYVTAGFLYRGAYNTQTNRTLVHTHTHTEYTHGSYTHVLHDTVKKTDTYMEHVHEKLGNT